MRAIQRILYFFLIIGLINSLYSDEVISPTFLKRDYNTQKITFYLDKDDFIQCKILDKKKNLDKPILKLKNRNIYTLPELNNFIVDAYKQGSKAFHLIEMGIQMDPHFYPLRYNAGRIYSLERNWTKAIDEFEYSTLEISNFYRPYIHLGYLYAIIGEKSKAEISFSTAHELNPVHPETLASLAHFFIEENMIHRLDKYFVKSKQLSNYQLDLEFVQILRNYHDTKYHSYSELLKFQKKLSANSDFANYPLLHYYTGQISNFLKLTKTRQIEYRGLLGYRFHPLFYNRSVITVQRLSNK